MKVLWSDEATFDVTCNRRGRIYRRPGSDPLDPRYTLKTVKHPDSLMVWGCFSGTSVGTLVVLPKNVKVNQHNYRELLETNLNECMDKCAADVFMQDGAPAHTARSVKNWMDDNNINFIRDWPGNSPDLNPIENLWDNIKKKLKGKDISSLPKLEAALRECWDAHPRNRLENLALSLPNRLELLKERRGKPTRYW